MVSTTWFALSGAAHLPPDIVSSLSREAAKVLQQADVRRRLTRNEIELKAMTPEEVTRFISSEIARWWSAAKAAAKATAPEHDMAALRPAPEKLPLDHFPWLLRLARS